MKILFSWSRVCYMRVDGKIDRQIAMKKLTLFPQFCERAQKISNL